MVLVYLLVVWFFCLECENISNVMVVLEMGFSKIVLFFVSYVGIVLCKIVVNVVREVGGFC